MKCALCDLCHGRGTMRCEVAMQLCGRVMSSGDVQQQARTSHSFAANVLNRSRSLERVHGRQGLGGPDPMTGRRPQHGERGAPAPVRPLDPTSRSWVLSFVSRPATRYMHVICHNIPWTTCSIHDGRHIPLHVAHRSTYSIWHDSSRHYMGVTT